MARGVLLSRPGSTLVVMLLAVLACGLCTVGAPEDRDTTILVALAPH
jgi:hypothetical protein